MTGVAMEKDRQTKALEARRFLFADSHQEVAEREAKSA
jgi:hypothetical protein